MPHFQQPAEHCDCRLCQQNGRRGQGARPRCLDQFASALLRKRISINLPPADIPKDSSSLDLATAASILETGQQIKRVPGSDAAIIGELELNGTIRPVRGIIGKLLSRRSKGLTTFFIPASNLAQAKTQLRYDKPGNQTTSQNIPEAKSIIDIAAQKIGYFSPQLYAGSQSSANYRRPRR